MKKTQQLLEWAEQAKLDPNDPNNAELFDYLKVNFCIPYFHLLLL
jgi:hypothetical protein